MSGFDHHCKWLNNCVGDENYTRFIALILCVFVNYGVVTIFCSISLSRYARNYEDYEEFLYDSYDTRNSYPFVGITIATLIVAALVMIAILHLLVLHTYLNYKGITTYEYVIELRKRKKVIDNIENRSYL